jgi:signal transduction histidine kinase/phage shock protein PspC (stress-responsive transcriptional regulator)
MRGSGSLREAPERPLGSRGGAGEPPPAAPGRMCDHRGMSDTLRQGRSSPPLGTARRPAPVLAGVASDTAVRLGVDPVVVRLALVVLAAAGGAGVLLYGILWLRRARDPRPPVPAPPVDAAGALGLALALGGLLLLLRTVGVWFGDGVVVPVTLGAVGSFLIWTRSDDRERARLAGALGLRGGPLRVAPARIAAGVALVAVAMVAFVAANDALVAVRQLGVALVAASIGIGLLFGPWALRLADTAREERRARIREEERGEIAAHLHDSVLQTLAMIQRSGDDPQRMAALARRQERELRRWLFEGRTSEDASTLSGALAAAVAMLEETHAIGVELVRVGDAPLTHATSALVAAVREAVGNAARHAGVDTVAVFVEVGADEVVAYVRDRGRGFDVAAVADDRSGIRHSIRGRLERRGGRATLTTEPGDGCEWELAVPLDAAGTADGVVERDEEVDRAG